MDYVIDTNTLTGIFRHYFVDRFRSFWEKFDEMRTKETFVL